MESRMEIIYVGNGDQGYKTGIGAIFETPRATWDAFCSARKIAVPLKTAPFLLDYYNRKGDLNLTIGLDEAGFELITGEKAKTAAEYAEIDARIWAEARDARAA